MKPSSTVEGKRLAKADAYITQCIARHTGNNDELRFQLLEAASSRLGGFAFEGFCARFGIKPLVASEQLLDDARDLVQLLDDTGIHPSLCLSALAREALDHTEQRKSGAYHTDFRLALHLAQSVEIHLKEGAKVIDPACGAGILLTAVSIVACGPDRILASEWLRHSVYAADLSPMALRGTRLSLASLTDDLDAIFAMYAHWRAQDSLLASDASWLDLSPVGFDVVIANPPWEKVKLTRHEYIKANGQTREYGTSYSLQSLAGYDAAKTQRAAMASSLVERYPVLAKGEPDLYVAFTELLYKLTLAGGHGALLVPAGLIRSLNTESLRRALAQGCDDLTFTVLENRARHFAIDTRFKFLVVNYRRSSVSSKPLAAIGVGHAFADNERVTAATPVRLPLKDLNRLRSDLTVPEVRSAEEWRLFKKMQMNGSLLSLADSPWHPEFCREIDMTHGRRHFVKQPQDGCLPVIEGRMVQPHRLGCKAYISGEGRSAVWRNLALGESRIAPQFWLPMRVASAQAKGRSQRMRAGFCDITGQTNERSMMAALIPPGVVCGNKVPTLTFPNDPSEERIFLWLAIVNSIPFDWLLRRIVTTTVNYFVLRSLRLPKIDIKSLPAQRLIGIARKLQQLDQGRNSNAETLWRIAELRAEADVLVARAYSCSHDDLRLMLGDFPLLDRGQPALPSELSSTITEDFLLSTWLKKTRGDDQYNAKRVESALQLGAMPYVSSEFSDSIKEKLNEAAQ
ncbi:Eco57I restriction-modification methylase domain-containing protein [Antarctobacter heliothermus]|uniref:site-specific DNA-methyltransferase (adenine-specific) n=1 Tax=Antarctobacter heliothermus TaxID=74033 RepID=A0A239HLR8_9RHOB|nr:N-6 DNA methylase [Antarctobacter heliothermus]SNS82346.1 Methyltransferase domain-containing protein [Antarctobacter heliothermus]